MKITLEIAKEIAKEIEAKGIAAEVTENKKADNIVIGITMGTGTVRPCLYPGTYEADTVSEVAELMVEHYNTLDIPVFDVSCYTDFDKVKENIVPCVRPKTYNNNDITVDYLDFEIYFRAKVDFATEGNASIVIKEEHLNTWNKSVDDIIAIATENASRNTYIDTMFNVLSGLIADIGFDEMLDNITTDFPMYIITNKSQYNGASNAYLCKAQLKAIADKLNDNVYILPSSIHEVIIIPCTGTDVDQLRTMVADVNESEVIPAERLSNNVYKYDRSTDEITIA